MLSPNDALDKPDVEKKMIGSFMILECDTYEDAKKMIEGDVYWTGNVVRRVFLQVCTSSKRTGTVTSSGTRRRRSSGPSFRPSCFLEGATRCSHRRT